MTAAPQRALAATEVPALGGERLQRMTPSAIREVHNLGAQLRAAHPERSFVALHFGEGDLGTPPFIVEAGVKALREGALFYENNAGRPDLLEALAEHYAGRYGVSLSPQHFLVTCGGVQAIHLAMEGLLSPGDQVINITPAWPNFCEAAKLAGGEVHDLALAFDEAERVFRLDTAALAALADRLPRLRMVIVNTPSNPTGWVMTVAEKAALLDFCRQRGAVLMADEMYERLVFREERVHSFLHLRQPGDRLVVINGFSKAYSMTGWRLGYLVAEPPLVAKLAEMQEFVTSCAPAMAQVAGLTGLREGESYVAESRARYQRLRDLASERLERLPGAVVARPDGAFYAFFRLPGAADSLAFCKALVTETGVSLAPGVAFGAGGEGWLRLCFAKEPALLEDAITRMEAFVNRHGNV